MVGETIQIQPDLDRTEEVEALALINVDEMVAAKTGLRQLTWVDFRILSEFYLHKSYPWIRISPSDLKGKLGISHQAICRHFRKLDKRFFIRKVKGPDGKPTYPAFYEPNVNANLAAVVKKFLRQMGGRK